MQTTSEESATKAFDEYVRSLTPTLVDFSAEWCEPCRLMIPILQELKNTLGSKATILHTDIDANPELAIKYRIDAVPTLMVFKAGELIWRQSGLTQAHELQSILEQHYAST